jgi:hypothetical protein
MSHKRLIPQSLSYSIFVTIIISAMLLSGCGLLKAASPTPIPPAPLLPTPTPETVLPTPQSVPTGSATNQESQVQDTPTAIPPTAIPPSPTPEPLLDTPTPVILNPQSVPTAAPQAAAGSIAFAAGTTAAVVQGSLQAGQVATYTLQAGQSQILVLIMDSPKNDVSLGVFEPNGNMLLNPANKWRSWQGVLPATELYKIQVTGGATTENFTLTVKVPQIVNFASGATSATLNGTSAYGYPFDYSFACGAGQTMTASLNVPASTAYLDVFGGSTSEMLLSDSARANTWTAVLPQTQPYVVEVVPNNFQVVSYSLTVSCTGAVGSPSSSTTGSIVIKPGSTAAVKHGTVGPGQVVSYTIQASQYQPMVLNIGTVGSTKNDVYLGVLYPDGSTFLSPTKKYLNWQWRLPVTGLYTIQAFGGATTENFELTIKLPRIVYFSGTNSITLKSATEQGFIVSYAIYGNFGETLTASLNVSSDIAYLDIYGLERGSLLSYKDKANAWTGVLPDTEMYIIEVIPRGGNIYSYTLTLTRE